MANLDTMRKRLLPGKLRLMAADYPSGSMEALTLERAAQKVELLEKMKSLAAEMDHLLHHALDR